MILSVVESYPSQLSGVKSVSGSSGEKNYIIIISIPFVKTLHQAHSRDLNPHPDQYLASNKVSCQRVGRIERPSLPITDVIFCLSFRAANRQTGFEKPIKILQCTSHQSHYYPLFLLQLRYLAKISPTSGNCGKLTALRCPIAVCSLLLYLIQRFIVLCKTLFKGRITVGSEAPSGKCPSITVSYWKRYARTSTTQTAMLPYRKLMWILLFELPQARPSDIWCSVFTISPPTFQRYKYTLGLDVRVMVPVE